MEHVSEERIRETSWTLQDAGRSLEVHTWAEAGRQHARLLVDGTPVAAGDCDVLGDVRLVVDDLRVQVHFLWAGRVRSVELVERTDGRPHPEDPKEAFRRQRLTTHRVPFVPPPGTRAARAHAWREAHPRLWATRHVALEVGGILAGVLGVGALLNLLLGKLLPSIDWSWLPDLPDIGPPDWLRYLDPFHWIDQLLPDVDWFGWVPDWDLPDLGWVKYVVILLIAVVVAVQEVRRRREREAREARRPGTGTADGE